MKSIVTSNCRPKIAILGDFSKVADYPVKGMKGILSAPICISDTATREIIVSGFPFVYSVDSGAQ